MQKYVNDITTVVDGKLEPLPNAPVTVYVGGTSTLATLYSDNGISTTTNPFISTNTGRVEFYAEDGRYDLIVSKTGYNSVSIPDIIFDDPAVYTGPTSIVVDTATPALTITQAGAGAALLVEDEASVDATPFIITADGKVGIGTDVPASPLTVVDAANQITATDGTVTQIVGGAVGSLGRAGTESNHAYTILTNNTEVARFTSTGRLGIGLTNPLSTFVVGTGAAAFPDGTSALPSITNIGDLNTGIFFPAADTIAFSTSGQEEMRITSAGLLGIGTVTPTNTLDVFGNYGFGAPVTKTANFTVANGENFIICAKTASTTVTLPDAVSYPGRIITMKTRTAFTVISASSNVKPRATDTEGTAILAATAGAWATLVSDGSFWIIMCGS
jgi:hypothetical protein